ncbi:MAG TPA: DUF2203 domain-containing protein [Phycisphaerae bacterium]|nr:DUF2203 domain-containing protein [Phycisphaerae bacterium]
MKAFTAASAERNRTHRGRKVFTLAQANRSLPLVSRIVTDVVQQHKKICHIEQRCQTVDHGHSMEDLERLRHQYAGELDALQDLIEELEQIGCQLKDWERGVVDFLAFINGRPVELCWRLGEAGVSHWHEIDAGFRGRLPLEDQIETGGPVSG